jgi:hypothetical protein
MWDESKAAALREFISRPIGQDFLDELTKAVTKTTGDTLEKRAITGSEREGGEIIIRKIEELRTWTNTPATSSAFIENLHES